MTGAAAVDYGPSTPSNVLSIQTTAEDSCAVDEVPAELEYADVVLVTGEHADAVPEEDCCGESFPTASCEGTSCA